MKIARLRIENFKRIEVVEITPDGKIVLLTGKMANGKSSILDAIAAVFGGKSFACQKPVRDGKKRGSIACKLDDLGLIVTRTFTETGGGALQVSAADGARYPSPQAVLDALVGKLTLDPLAFSRMDSSKQVDTLRKLVGLDFAVMDKERADAYEERTQANRAAATLLSQITATPFHDDAPAEEVSVLDLANEYRRRQGVNASNAKVRQSFAIAESELARCVRLIEEATSEAQQTNVLMEGEVRQLERDLAAEIARLNKQCAQRIQAVRDRAAMNIKGAADRVARWSTRKADLEREVYDLGELAAVLVDVDPDELGGQMAQAEEMNRKVRYNARRATLEDESDNLKRATDALTQRIDAIDAGKKEMLANAAFPIAGLSFDDDGVLFNGIPFSQASGGEKLCASVAIGLALEPKLKVMLVRDGSLLNTDGMRILTELAEKHDVQIWLERVTDGGEVGIVIEDGRVAGAPVEALA